VYSFDYLKYILTGNFGEICAIFLAPFFGLPFPLLAIHILWINFGNRWLTRIGSCIWIRGIRYIMKRPPKDPKQNIFTKRRFTSYGWFLMGITLLVHKHGQLNIVYHIGKQLCSQPSVSAKCDGSFPTSSFSKGLLSNKPLLLTILITVSLQLVIIYLFFLMLFSKPNRLLLN
jgi:Ca2+-transporting ATPase